MLTLNFVSLLLVVAFTKGVRSFGLPLVRWHPGSPVEEGDTVRLECQLDPTLVGPAIWLKLDPSDPDSHIVLSHGDLVVTDDPRFSARHVPDVNTYVVQINEVSEDDAGSYQCQVPVNSAEEELKVVAPPPVVVTLRLSAMDSASDGSPSQHLLLLLVCLLVFAR